MDSESLENIVAYVKTTTEFHELSEMLSSGQASLKGFIDGGMPTWVYRIVTRAIDVRLFTNWQFDFKNPEDYERGNNAIAKVIDQVTNLIPADVPRERTELDELGHGLIYETPVVRLYPHAKRITVDDRMDGEKWNNHPGCTIYRDIFNSLAEAQATKPEKIVGYRGVKF